MRIFGVYLLALTLLSSSVFVLGQNVRFKPWVKTGQEAEYATARKALETLHSPVDRNAGPKLLCECSDFDFGVMNIGDIGKHRFTVTNVGVSPLALSDAGTSCGCLKNDFGVLQLEPGESTQLQLEWTPFERDEIFSKQQKIETNDPDQPELLLTVHGIVHATLQAVPDRIVLDRLLPGKSGHRASFEIYSESLETLEVDRLEVHNLDGTCELVRCYFDEEDKRAVAKFDFVTDTPVKPVSGVVRVFFKMPSGGGKQESLFAGLKRQSDDTVLMEVPVDLMTLRRMSLYSPLLETLRDVERSGASSHAKIELGKLFQRDSAIKSWALIGRFRGTERPETISVQLSGIPGLVARVDIDQDTKGKLGDSFRIVLESKSKIPVGVYDRRQAGALRIETPGLPGEELLEMPVTLDVLSDKERAR